MAIIGKSADEIKGLLGNAQDLALLVDILQDKKSLASRVTELEGIDDLLAKKADILKALDKQEKLAVKNENDKIEIEATKVQLSRLSDDLKIVQKNQDERGEALKADEKTLAKAKADAEKALQNAAALEAANKTKAAKLDKLIEENEAKSGQMDAAIAAYKNKLSVLDQVA